MFTPTANLDVSWPDPKVLSNDSTQKWLQASTQYIVPTTTTNDSTTVGNQSNSFTWMGASANRTGIITFAPLGAAAPLFIDTATLNAVTSSAATNYECVSYNPYDDKFYYSGAGGVARINASNTASAAEVITTTATTGVTFQSNIVWMAPTATSTPIRWYNIDTRTSGSAGSNIAINAREPIIAPNGLIILGGAGTTLAWYDPYTNTNGTMGTVASDSSYNLSLGRDGYIYSVPRFTNTSVYRIDPYKKTITTVLTGSPYTATIKRGQWVMPDGRIATTQGANALVLYDPITNSASTFTFTFGYSSAATHAGCSTQWATAVSPTTGTAVFNKVNNRNILNNAWAGSTFRAGGQN